MLKTSKYRTPQTYSEDCLLQTHIPPCYTHSASLGGILDPHLGEGALLYCGPHPLTYFRPFISRGAQVTTFCSLSLLFCFWFAFSSCLCLSSPWKLWNIDFPVPPPHLLFVSLGEASLLSFLAADFRQQGDGLPWFSGCSELCWSMPPTPVTTHSFLREIGSERKPQGVSTVMAC